MQFYEQNFILFYVQSDHVTLNTKWNPLLQVPDYARTHSSFWSLTEPLIFNFATNEFPSWCIVFTIIIGLDFLLGDYNRLAEHDALITGFSRHFGRQFETVLNLESWLLVKFVFQCVANIKAHVLIFVLRYQRCFCVGQNTFHYRLKLGTHVLNARHVYNIDLFHLKNMYQFIFNNILKVI